MSMLENWEKTSISDETRYYMENESGRFYCDEKGRLIFFESVPSNCLHQPPFGFREKNCMQMLTLPEGIREIGKYTGNLTTLMDGTLRGLVVVENLVLPKSLEKIDANVLSGCLIMEMELPTSLREIGPGALMCNYIHVLRIPQGMLHPQFPSGWDQKKVDGALTIYGRQFKETIINTLIVPREYPYQELMIETKINNIIYSD